MSEQDEDTRERLEFIFRRFRNDATAKGFILPEREKMILWTLNQEAAGGCATREQIEAAWQMVFGG